MPAEDREGKSWATNIDINIKYWHNPSAKLLAEIWEGQLKISLPTFIKKANTAKPSGLFLASATSEASSLMWTTWSCNTTTKDNYFHPQTSHGELAKRFCEQNSRVLEWKPCSTRSPTYLHGVFLSIYAVLWAREVSWLTWDSPVQMEFYCLVFYPQASSSDFRGCVQCHFNWGKKHKLFWRRRAGPTLTACESRDVLEIQIYLQVLTWLFRLSVPEILLCRNWTTKSWLSLIWDQF